MTQPNHEHFMKLALEACWRGIESGQTPFGACVVRGEQVIAQTHNHVWLDTDITAHAEVCSLLALQTSVNTRGRCLSRAIAALRSLLITPVAPK